MFFLSSEIEFDFMGLIHRLKEKEKRKGKVQV